MSQEQINWSSKSYRDPCNGNRIYMICGTIWVFSPSGYRLTLTGARLVEERDLLRSPDDLLQLILEKCEEIEESLFWERYDRWSAGTDDI